MRLAGAWEVNAGLVPGLSLEEYRKQYFYTSKMKEEDRERPPGERSHFTALMEDAHEYAMRISEPSRVNWVSVFFVWY